MSAWCILYDNNYYTLVCSGITVKKKSKNLVDLDPSLIKFQMKLVEDGNVSLGNIKTVSEQEIKIVRNKSMAKRRDNVDNTLAITDHV